MPPDLEYLEYGEESDGEDLFGSDTELPPAFAQPDTRIPILPGGASSGARPKSPPATTALDSPPRHKLIISPATKIDKNDLVGETSQTAAQLIRVTPDQRMVQLRNMRATIPPPPEVGVPSLKNYCSMVIRSNATRIYDVGGLEYNLLEEFLSNCPREQLAEIEENSTHIKKDTDWLWEYFVIDEYPLFYESCRLRKGQPRTSGWRRMYEKGAQDAKERQTQARERVANRYRQLEADRQSKRIVVLDTLVAPKANKFGRASPAHSLSSARRGAAASAPYSQQNKLQSAINKARSDSQRARVALTHASGRFMAPTASSAQWRRPGEPGNELYSNPYNAAASGSGSGSASASTSTPPQRLPAPRVPRPKGVLPAAYPTPDPPSSSEKRKSAPSASGSSPSYAPAAPYSTAPSSKEERFRIDPHAKREMHTVHKPKVENFPTRKPIDFFNASSPMSSVSASASAASPRKRVLSTATAGSEAKRPRPLATTSRGSSPDGEREPPSTSASAPASAPTSQPPSRPHTPGAPGAPGAPGTRPLPPPRPKRDLENILFVKKRKPPPSKLFPNKSASAPAPARR